MHCSSKSRHTLGIIIGSVYILISSIIFSLSVFSYLESNPAAEQKQKFPTEVAVSCLVSVLISALLILSIVKNLQNLMIPWFLLCVAVFFGSCFFLFILFFAAGLVNASEYILYLILLIGVCIIGIEIGIFWFSCHLYREIRRLNSEKTASIAVSYQNEAKNYTSI